MKLKNIFENEKTEVHLSDRFSFKLKFHGEQKIAIKNFILDKNVTNTYYVKDGDVLSFDYQPEWQGANNVLVMYELRMYNTKTNEKRFIEDAEFNLRSEEDITRFKTEIQQKLESLKLVLDAQEIQNIIKIYQQLLKL